MDEKETHSDVKVKLKSKKTVYKNLLIVGSMQLLIFAAISPTAALVTSTAGKTLGNITFGLSNIFSCLFSFFTISVLDKETNKKTVILFGSASFIGFTACNWYVSYYTLIPGALLFGVGLSTSWIASIIYIKRLSIDYTIYYNLNEQRTTSWFTGIIMGFSLAGYTLGNATASGVLMLLKQNSDNDTVIVDRLANHSGATRETECHTDEDKLEFNFVTMNVLRGLIVLYSLLAFIIVLLFLDSLQKRSLQNAVHPSLVMFKFIKSIWLNAVAITKLLHKMELIMSCPLFIASGASLSFVYTIYTKVSALVSL